MVKSLNRAVLAAALLGLMALAPGRAQADILLDLTDAPGQTNTPYSLSFTATDVTTSVSIGGYQLPSFEQTTDIGVFAGNAGPNLLGPTWVLVPASPFDTDTDTFNDGTSVPALEFGSTGVGDYDTYTQTFTTTVGQSYTLDFLYSNDSSPFDAPSGLLVTTTASAVPEPASLTLLGIAGLVGAGYSRSRRKRAARA